MRIKRIILFFLAALAVLYGLLLIPDHSDTIPSATQSTVFEWNADALWHSLEDEFNAALVTDTNKLDVAIRSQFQLLQADINILQKDSVYDPTVLDSTLHHFFAIAPLVAVRSGYADSLVKQYAVIKQLLKGSSRNWNMQDVAVKNNFYKCLYGMRAAVEEVLLQSNDTATSPVIYQNKLSSSTPATVIEGIEVHSGDIFVSRGGAEVSALISRGNDYPGNFSHVALLYVDDKTKEPSFVEAHIERGVAVATAAQYLKDIKLRFMVLRLNAANVAYRHDLLLPHKAASFALQQHHQKHIPYDFALNYTDHHALFCSEVASQAYDTFGVKLWNNLSTISASGVRNWLYAFGVSNFVTQMPSDLEYDTDLDVVAEWCNKETLFKDHIDNAVMDVLIEQANKGEQLQYNIWQLPLVRLVKGYCMLMNSFGKEAIIPEGMSATQALKNQYFVAQFAALKKRTEPLVEKFIQQHHYRPPYWKLIKLTQQAAQGL